jgi:hypothetical protein
VTLQFSVAEPAPIDLVAIGKSKEIPQKTIEKKMCVLEIGVQICGFKWKSR